MATNLKEPEPAAHGDEEEELEEGEAEDAALEVEEAAQEEKAAFGTSLVKEVVAGLIALAIVGVTLVLIARAFNTSGEQLAISASDVANDPLLQAKLAQQQQAQEGQKDILLIAIGLMGAVTGYFFSRVTTERGAERSEQAARTANRSARQAERRAGRARAGTARMSERRNEAERSLRRTRERAGQVAERIRPAAARRKTLGAPAAGGGGPAGMSAEDAELIAAQAELEAIARGLV
jgi:hypothetical protein